MKEHLDMLGLPVKDRVTGFEGVVTSVTFDLYGCVQGYVYPKADKDGKIGDGHWFDTKRLEKMASQRVMPQPEFEQIPGGQSLPAPRSEPG